MAGSGSGTLRRYAGIVAFIEPRNFGTAGLDLGHVVERDGDKLQRARPVVAVYLHQIGKFIAAWIAIGGPEVNEQRMFSLLRD